ncbi:MAG: respiratory nitrate reductase subunit gamma [Verrucomicrobia bacterium]|nr:respiratory nitrate reductase subunit gamma [Verrucomicrobiota bacterium]
MKSPFLTNLLWGVYPYLCITLFLVVPVIRMMYRPFGFSTRATGLFNRDVLGVASLTLHWGLVLLLLGHLAGFIGGLLGLDGWLQFFYWAGLIGGFSALLGSIIALVRRVTMPEARAMSQWDDYLVHLFLIAIMTVALWQVTVDRIFGVAYTASSWLASVARFAPQPELMDSASLISKWHVFLALTFFALFPFTKLVHFWTFPVNYFVRPYQSMRTNLFKYQRKWEFALRSDKSFLTYSLVGVVLFFGGFSLLLGHTRTNGSKAAKPTPTLTSSGRLAGMPLFVSQCARCHGLDGKGDGLGALSPTFARPPRNLASEKILFVSTDNGIASDDDLARTIRGGLVSAGMPAFPELDDHQVASLVAVMRHFRSGRGESPGTPIPVAACPPSANVTRGGEVFQMACAPCHGSTGRGDGANVATMKDFAGRPIQPRDLTKGELKVSRAPEQIYLRIATGVDAMPAFKDSLPPEDIWSVVRFVEVEFLSGKMARQLAASGVKQAPATPPKKPEAGAGSFE